MPKEKGKKKGNAKSKTIAPKKTDYKTMFTKYYKMKDAAMKD